MPQYSYKAKDLQGREISGFLEATNEHQLSQLLRQQGYFLLSQQTNEKTEANITKPSISILSKLNALGSLFSISLTDKLFFTRNLEVMIKTGVSLVRAFDILSSQTHSKKFQKALKEISGRISKGEGLSQSLSHYPRIFPVLFQETVKVGEETGK